MDKQEFTIPFSEEEESDVKRLLMESCLRIPKQQQQNQGEQWKQGTNYDVLYDVIRYWRTEYSWKRVVDELNVFHNYTTIIDDLKIHFIEEKTNATKAIPLLLLHGWPGSVYEFHDIISLLTADQGGEGFHVVAPSLPGYGWSEQPKQEGVNVHAVADLFDKLMQQLGYTNYIVQGGDWGGIIARSIASRYPKSCVGLHTNFPICVPPKVTGPLSLFRTIRYFSVLLLAPLIKSKMDATKVKVTQLFLKQGTGYQAIQGTKPETLGVALNSSPVALLSWFLEKFYSWSDSTDENPFQSINMHDIVTHVMIYWTTGTITSSIRFYYESLGIAPGKQSCLSPGFVCVPSGLCVFPREILQIPKSVAERSYNVISYTEANHGGHFAALEQPKVLEEDIRRFSFHVTNFPTLVQQAQTRTHGNVSAPIDMVDIAFFLLLSYFIYSMLW
eukprot:m.78316 g.78316  ORF g.78316 m.78316 type:complete len:444 (-) comp8569_c0_seq1:2302-3633(-)